MAKQYIGMQPFKDVLILVKLRVCEFFKCINKVFMDFDFMRTQQSFYAILKVWSLLLGVLGEKKPTQVSDLFLLHILSGHSP